MRALPLLLVRLSLLMLLAAWPLASVAQLAQQSLSIERIGGERGLPDLVLYGLAFDRDGMLWLGGDAGLMRYDGYRFDVLDDRDAHRFADRPLVGAEVGTILVDRRDRIWAAHWGEGMSRLDRRTGRMSHYRRDPAEAQTLSTNLVQVVFEDRDGGVWIGTTNGLNRYDETLDRIVPVEPLAQPYAERNAQRIWSIAQAPDGALWIGSESGLARFDPARDPRPVAQPLVDGDAQRIRLVHWDRYRRLWIGTERSFGWRDTDGRYRPLPVPADLRMPWVRANSLVEDADHAWLATSSGMHRISLLTPQFVPVLDDRYVLLPTDNLRSMRRDASGTLWIASRMRGLLRLVDRAGRAWTVDPTPAGFDDPSGFAEVKSIAIDGQGTTWLATGRTLLYAPPGSDRYTEAIPRFPALRRQMYALRAVRTAPDGSLLAAGAYGAFRLWPDTGRHQVLIEPPPQYSPTARAFTAILADRSGRVWLGSPVEGVLRLAPDGTVDRTLNTQAELQHRLDSDRITTLFEDRSGRIWIGTYDGGVSVYLPEEDRVIAFRAGAARDALADDRVHAILQTRDDAVWVATANGLSRFDPDTGDFADVPVTASGDATPVLGLFEDRTGKPWAVLVDRIVSLADARTTADERRYADASGEAFRFNANAATLRGDGHWMLGGDRGVLIVAPSANEGDSAAPRATITRVAIDQAARPLTVGDTPQVIVLDADERAVTIELAASDLNAATLNQFRYRLAGIDPQLQVTDVPSVGYNRLPPGDYLFEAWARGSGGAWSAAPAQLQLRVLPPWWKDIRTVAVLAIALLALLVAALRLHVGRVRRREVELAREVGDRTRTIVQQQEQLVLQEKMASLGTLTAGVAHEIDNPVHFTHLGAQNMAADLDALQYALTERAYAIEPQLAADFELRIRRLREHLSGITDGAERIRGIVATLRSFSRSDAGERGPIAIVELLDGTLALVRARFKHGVTFVTDHAASPTVDGWPGELRQVFMHLALAACHAIVAHRTGTLQVRTRQQGDEAWIEFEDDAGDRDAAQGRIFESQADAHSAGGGLGLSICDDIVHKHGGRIEHATTNSGTCVRVVLPIGR